MLIKNDHIEYLRGLLVDQIILKDEQMSAHEESIIKDIMAFLTIEEYTLNRPKQPKKSNNTKDGSTGIKKDSRPRNDKGQYAKKNATESPFTHYDEDDVPFYPEDHNL